MEVEPRVRTFVVTSVALAFPAVEAGFQLGAYGEIFVMRKVASWSLVTAALLALVVVPRKARPVGWWQLLVLAVPSIWLIASWVHAAEWSGEVLRPAIFALGLVSYLVCIPFAAYLLIRLLKPDLLVLSGTRPRLALVGLLLAFIGAGYLIGARNDLFMTCQDFVVAGAEPAANCRQ